ncbi:family 78 glycoside hydrolase catalytic domain [Paenibacillus sp. WC2504]|uniref:family 78 glycoside hydrolase catalytic domain n=1 Tax=Paenibacillus sp. WC2504 TaxID=3461403 RepID=UPI004045F0D4
MASQRTMQNKFKKRALTSLLIFSMLPTMLVPATIFANESEAPSTANVADATFRVKNLKTEQAVNPLGLDTLKPRLSWQMGSEARSQKQTAYQVLVASTPELLSQDQGDVWDSGKLLSDQSANVAYAGEELQTSHRYYWKVRIWDKDDQMSDWSVQDWWEMGLLKPSDWKASWITVPNEQIPINRKYSIDLDFTILEAAAGFVFGSQDSSHFYMWQINVKDKPYAQFRPHKWNPNPSVIKEKNISSIIPDAAKLNTAHHMKIDVNGDQISTYVDQQLVDTLQDSSFSLGKIGFRQHKDNLTNERASFDNINIKDENGNSVFTEDFSDPDKNVFGAGKIENGQLVLGELASDLVIKQSQMHVPQLRKAFTITKPVKKATVYATALGLYELSMNGHRVGEDHLAPGFTDYNQFVQYQAYDVTGMLESGHNALGALLGDGWYSGHVAMAGENIYGDKPEMLLQMNVEYQDGTKDEIVSDSSWKIYTSGPIIASDLLMGETYDARNETKSWDKPAYDDTNWIEAQSVNDYKGKLTAQVGPSVQATQELTPKAITQPTPGVYIFDLGQNMVGWARLKATGALGSKVQMRFGEMLNDDGSLYTANLRTAKQTDVYTLKGEGLEVYEPHFTFHGFRYVEITGYPGVPTLDSITGVVVHSNLEPSATFETSNSMVNQIYSNIVWGQRGNFLSIPTDCPQRDERMGWTGDAQIFSRTASYNMNTMTFFEKYMRDVVSGQNANGAFPDVAPHVSIFGEGNNAWGDVGVIVPWTVYLTYNDKRIIEDNYAAMVKWIDYLKTNSNSLIRPDSGFGDWLNIEDETPKDVLNTAYFAYSTMLMSKMAKVIGNEVDAQKYDSLFNDIKTAFNQAFVDKDGHIKGNTQTGYVLALQMNLLPEDKQPLSAKYLVDLIKGRDYHLSTGFVGVGYLLPVLTKAGYSDVAYHLLTNDTFPSWGYEIKNGATTIWERWNSYTKEGGFGDVGMNSFNHYSLGSVGEWMFRYAAGIEADPDQPGFKHTIIQPTVGGEFQHVNAEYDSFYGKITSGWKVDGNNFSLDVTIPANTTATVYVPTNDQHTVKEGGKSIEEVAGIRYVKMDNGKAVYEVGSGSYSFTSLLTITGSPLSSVSLNSDQAKMIVGQTTQLNVTAKKENGVAIDLAKAQTAYKSSNANVATVDAAGKVKAVGFGNVKITVDVTYEGITVSSSNFIFVTNGTNLALGKKASSNNTITVAPTWNISNLTDGNLDLKYSSDGFVSNDVTNNPIWVEIDLGSAKPFNNLVLYPRTDSRTPDGQIASFPTNFDIQVKSDNGEYKTVKQIRGQTTFEASEPQRYYFATENARYVRVVVTQFGPKPHDDVFYRFQLAETEIYNVEAQTMLTGPSVVTSGQAFDIAYGLSGVTDNVYAQDLTLTYDPAQMEFLSVDSLFTNLEIAAISDVTKNSGKVRILSALVGGDHTVNGDLLAFHMRAKSSSTAATVTLSDVIFANGNGAEKNITGTSYSVQIAASIHKEELIALIADAQAKHDAAVEGTHTGQYPVGSRATLQAAIDKAQSVVNDASVTQQQLEQATAELTSGLQAFTSSIIISTPGDTNGDDRISIGDLAVMASYYGKKSTYPNWNLYKKADLNNDGVIDIEDLAALARLIIG